MEDPALLKRFIMLLRLCGAIYREIIITTVDTDSTVFAPVVDQWQQQQQDPQRRASPECGGAARRHGAIIIIIVSGRVLVGV